MPARRKLPPANELKKLVESGLTHAEIAELVSATTGERVARAAVTTALQRAGVTSGERLRHDVTVPWRVKERHAAEYPPRMLRLLGQRMAGRKLSEADCARLDSFLARLERNDEVIGYCPDAPVDFGFHYISASLRTPDWPAPVRVQSLSLDQIPREALTEPNG